LANDPLEVTNLAHATHHTPAADAQRVRLHRRLADVMRACGTEPDEIRWPEVADFRPATRIAVADEDEVPSE
jgi:hypothetical protein